MRSRPSSLLLAVMPLLVLTAPAAAAQETAPSGPPAVTEQTQPAAASEASTGQPATATAVLVPAASPTAVRAVAPVSEAVVPAPAPARTSVRSAVAPQAVTAPAAATSEPLPPTAQAADGRRGLPSGGDVLPWLLAAVSIACTTAAVMRMGDGPAAEQV